MNYLTIDDLRKEIRDLYLSANYTINDTLLKPGEHDGVFKKGFAGQILPTNFIVPSQFKSIKSAFINTNITSGFKISEGV